MEELEELHHVSAITHPPSLCLNVDFSMNCYVAICSVEKNQQVISIDKETCGLCNLCGNVW